MGAHPLITPTTKTCPFTPASKNRSPGTPMSLGTPMSPKTKRKDGARGGMLLVKVIFLYWGLKRLKKLYIVKPLRELAAPELPKPHPLICANICYSLASTPQGKQEIGKWTPSRHKIFRIRT